MQIRYNVAIPHPSTHLATIEMCITDIQEDSITLAMPVWTPGSYMVREFSRHINSLKAYAGDKRLPIDKYAKNKWKLATQGMDTLTIEYEVYAFELTVRTSYISEDFFILNGASLFLYIEHYQHISHYASITAPYFAEIVSTLKYAEDSYFAQNYDTLVDHPILGGDFDITSYIAGNVEHYLYILGKGNYHLPKLKEDLQKITTYEIKVMGGMPCDKYHFYIINTDKIYGGLEHCCCSVNMVPRFNYDKDNYLSTISLLAHEYFHLWNIKTIRPQSLQSFDYSEENYTRLLWFVEGITSFFDDYFVYKAGISTLQEYLAIVAKNINTTLNNAGNSIQSLGDASFDAWIKYYRQNENAPNTQVSYYVKGSVVALALHLYLLQHSDGEKGMDDIMSYFYQKYITSPQIGYTYTSIITWVKECTGIDIVDFLEKYVEDVQELPLDEYLQFAGISLVDNTVAKNTLGIQLQYSSNQCMITYVDRRYPAYLHGLQYGDEIIAIDGYRIIDASWEKRWDTTPQGNVVKLTISRLGTLREVAIPMEKSRHRDCSLHIHNETTPLQQKIRSRWL